MAMSSSQPITSGIAAAVTVESSNKEDTINLHGDWVLHAATPSWQQIIPKCQAPTIKITADNLGVWDTALLLFLIHGKAWCRTQKKTLDTSSLPTNIQRILQHAEARSSSHKIKEKASSTTRLFLKTKIIEFLENSREAVTFIGNCTLGIFRAIRRDQKFRWIDCFLEMQQCWSSSLPIVSFISFLVGVILAFQGAIQLQRYGAGILVVDLVSLSIVREMGPMMAAIVVAGGTGAGFAAQLGNMKVDEEIDALETLGISSINFLVLPRLLAVTIMMPILAIYANVLGLLGGMYISATMLSIPAAVYWNEMQNRVSLSDVASGIIKSFIFGIMIALAGCLSGMRCQRNTAGVGSATSSAVVTSIMLIILVDALFSVIYNTLGI